MNSDAALTISSEEPITDRTDHLHNTVRWLLVALVALTLGTMAEAVVTAQALHNQHDLQQLELEEHNELGAKLDVRNQRIDQLVQALSKAGIPIPPAPTVLP